MEKWEKHWKSKGMLSVRKSRNSGVKKLLMDKKRLAYGTFPSTEDAFLF